MIKNVTNIDTLYILVDIFEYEKSSSEVRSYLNKEKDKAKLTLINEPDYKHIINIGTMKFELLTNGSVGYSYILRNTGYEVKIAEFQSGIENYSPIQIRISSEYLWSKGFKKAWQLIKYWITTIFGKIKTHKISRVDLCMHTSDIDFIFDYENTYKGVFKKTSITFTGNKINCLTFGTRKGKNVYCRIYNKTLEIKETRKKPWFIQIWLDNNLDIENVWNLEFELKSEFLRDFNIISVEDLELKLNDIWKYCTEKWLVKVNRINSRIERCPTDEKWKDIQQAYNMYKSKGLIKREKQIDIEADTLIPNIIGNITSYSARKDITDMYNAFENLYITSKAYLEKRNTDFTQETLKKIEIIKERSE